MSYVTSKAALIIVLAGVTGVAQVLGYEPSSIQQTPMIYVLLDRFDRTVAGQMTSMKYRLVCRVVVPWQDNEQAEIQLDPFVNRVAAAIDANPSLSGTITGGVTKTVEGEAVFVTVGGTLYRALDVFVELPDKGPYRGGL